MKNFYLSSSIAIAMMLATSVVHAEKTANVTVSAKANGNFSGLSTTAIPLVAAIEVTEAGIINVSASGTWNFGVNFPSGPGGVTWNQQGNGISPLMGAAGLGFGAPGGGYTPIGALIGAFIPRSTAKQPGFKANIAYNGYYSSNGNLNGELAFSVGIPAASIFYIGAESYVTVNGPGTLYLGINDEGVDDNSGDVQVKLTSYP
jgi:hypothetical protein